MAAFHHQIPTNSWQSLLWMFGVLGCVFIIFGLMPPYRGELPAFIFRILAICLGVGACLLTWRWWRYPDRQECIVAEGYLYWHAPWPYEWTGKVRLDRITSVVIDWDQEAVELRLELKDGTRLVLPELGMRTRLGDFMKAVRSQSPTTRVTQYGQPLRPM